MEIYEMKERLRCAESDARDVMDGLDDLESALSEWEELEGMGYSGAAEVIERLERLGDIEAGVEILTEETGIELDGESAAQDIIDTLKASAADGSSEIVAAIQMLVGALNRAGVLGGTEIVPAPSKLPSPLAGAAPFVAVPNNNADSGESKE